MPSSSKVFPTIWHRWFSEWILRSSNPRMGMATWGWPFVYTILSSVAIYGVAMVIYATHPTNNVSLGLATAVFALVALVTVPLAITFTLRLLFMPLNIERDPLVDLLDVMDAWIASINGLTSVVMIIFMWDPTQFGAALATRAPYGTWLLLLFTTTHDFHSAGFGTVQAVGDWALVCFIIVSYIGRIVLVLGISALVRLISRNIKRFPKRYVTRIDSQITPAQLEAKRARARQQKEDKLKRVGLDRRSKRVVSRRGAIRGPTTTRALETPTGGFEVR